MKRVPSIDIARGMSVLMLATIHTLWMYGDLHTQENTLVGQIIHLLGRGTPIFLIAMGISFTLSRHQSLRLTVKRGLVLLGLGFLMNALKFWVPIAVGFAPDNFVAAYGWETPLEVGEWLYLLGTGDILQLAGVSMFLIGLVQRYSRSKYAPLVLALVIMSLSQELRGTMAGIPFVDYLLKLLWGADWAVYFAVFPWASFILMGMFVGRWFVEKDRQADYIFPRLIPMGVVLLGVGWGLCQYQEAYHFGDYFHLGPGGALYLTGFNFILYGAVHYLARWVPHNHFFSFLYYSSARVTRIYIIQWVLICWGMGLVGYQQLNAWQVLVAIPITTGLAYGVQAVLERIFWSPKRAEKQVAV